MKSIFCLIISYAALALYEDNEEVYGCLPNTPALSPLSIIFVTIEIEDEINATSSKLPL